MTYYVYILRCGDGSLYTGITTDVARRLAEHKAGRGAKYTRSRGATGIEAAWSCETKGEALKLESAIKKLPKAKKESLASGAVSLDDVIGRSGLTYIKSNEGG